MNTGTLYLSLIAVLAVLTLCAASWLFARSVRTTRAFAGASVFACLVGVALALNALRSAGYAAPYSFGAAWLIAGTFIVGGLLMLPLRALRRGGLVALAAGSSLLVTFYLIILPAKVLGLTAWAR
jgi:hypothetical protein